MIIKLIYNTKTKIKEVQSNISEEDIKALFKVFFNITYDPLTCTYKIIKEGD